MLSEVCELVDLADLIKYSQLGYQLEPRPESEQNNCFESISWDSPTSRISPVEVARVSSGVMTCSMTMTMNEIILFGHRIMFGGGSSGSDDSSDEDTFGSK